MKTGEHSSLCSPGSTAEAHTVLTLGSPVATRCVPVHLGANDPVLGQDPLRLWSAGGMECEGFDFSRYRPEAR